MALCSFGTQNVQPGSFFIFSCLKRNAVLCMNANICWYWFSNKYMPLVLALYPLTVVRRSESSPACVRYWCEDIPPDLWGVAFTVFTAKPRPWSGSGHTRLTRKLSPRPRGFIINALAEGLLNGSHWLAVEGPTVGKSFRPIIIHARPLSSHLSYSPANRVWAPCWFGALRSPKGSRASQQRWRGRSVSGGAPFRWKLESADDVITLEQCANGFFRRIKV